MNLPSFNMDVLAEEYCLSKKCTRGLEEFLEKLKTLSVCSRMYKIAGSCLKKKLKIFLHCA